MASMTSLIGAVFAGALALGLSACAHSGARVERNIGSSVEHWTVYAKNAERGQVAIIAARDGDAYISASCYYDATVAFNSTAELQGSRRFALGFDGAAPVQQSWRWRAYQPPRWAFETSKQDADIRGVVKALRDHQQVEAVVTDGTGKVLDLHFSLKGAGEALDLAFKNCPV
jgi:hypothetical protein